MTTIIHNISILFLEDGKELDRGMIVVENDAISYAGPPKEWESTEDVRYINGDGGIAMPGFVNTHTHTPMGLLRGLGDDLPLERWLEDAIYPVEEDMGPTDFYWGSMLAAAEMLAGGTVAFSDMYMGPDATARVVERSGLRGVLSRGMACFSDDLGEVREKIVETLEFNGRWMGKADGRIMFSMAPHAEYTCSKVFLKECARVAREHNLLFHTHISETKGEHDACMERHGKTPTALMEELGVWENKAVAAHCVHITPADMGILKKHGVGVSHNPRSNLKLASGIAPVKEMLEVGIPVSIGTDGAASNNNLDMLEDTRLCGLLQKGITGDAALLPAEQVLRMATLGGREALGLPDGRLMAGNKADLIIINTNTPHMQPLRNLASGILYGAKASDVALTMVDGKVLYHKGEHLTLNINRILAEAEGFALREDPMMKKA
ncbi:amidohydrolase [Eubacteriales bacterium OttesenSCG-928-M02]|nr:amidohydrolase [Eubacteriales bacterium OttesenSCG-928-M02]